jgi:diguanylate cyclase (GGDEF)-like protein
MTEERKKYAVFSKPYVIYPLAIATKNDIGFIFDTKYLKDKIIAIGHNYTAAKLMLKNFPDYKYIFLNTTDEALKMLEKGEVYAVVDILPVLAYKINKYEFKDLKIADQIPIRFPVRFMLSKKYAYLLPKINKAISLMAFDIRDFKGINRFYGHHFGDITLLELTSAVKSILKKNEHFARINGGTFIIMLTKTEIGACERAKEIYDEVQNLEFSIVKDINYTFAVKTFYNEKTSQEILAEMEKKLQKNKKNNRVFTC